LSRSALERRFRRVIGISPKKFASLVRLRRAVRLRATGAEFGTVASFSVVREEEEPLDPKMAQEFLELLHKVELLKAMTVERGCTPEEADVALQKCRRQEIHTVPGSEHLVRS
jgi:AraC-like DNA-binding protein